MFTDNPILKYIQAQKDEPVEIVYIEDKKSVETKHVKTQTDNDLTSTSPWMNFMTKYRGAILVGVVLPISFCLEIFFEVRDWMYRNFLVTPELHEERVRKVQEQVHEWNKKELRGKRFMCTARPSWLTMSTRTASFKEDCFQIECNLRDILHIDKERNVVKTEPLVDMRYMTRYLIPKGYQLAVQVEMEDLTVGGLCMGLGMETTSHRFGLIQETIESFDIVTADGTLLHVTRDSHPELFYTLPWSHGTLGFLVAVELRIIPIKSYVRVNYLPCYTQDDLCERMKVFAEMEKPPDFLEATVYSQNESVLMFSYFQDANLMTDWNKINFVNCFWKPWYYLHCKKALDNGAFSEYIPIRHYHHRFTRSIFWELRDLIPFGNHPLYRYCLGWLGAPKVSLIKKTMTPQIRKEVFYKHAVQDIIIPIDKMKESINKFHEWFEVYPLLVFPIAVFDHSPYQGMMRNPKTKIPGKSYEMYFDLGVYGIPQKVRDGKFWDAEKVIREMEEYTRNVGGYQCLYADTLMSQTEFRKMLHHDTYDKLRKEYNCIGAFPEIYEKIKPEKNVILS